MPAEPKKTIFRRLDVVHLKVEGRRGFVVGAKKDPQGARVHFDPAVSVLYPSPTERLSVVACGGFGIADAQSDAIRGAKSHPSILRPDGCFGNGELKPIAPPLCIAKRHD